MLKLKKNIFSNTLPESFMRYESFIINFSKFVEKADIKKFRYFSEFIYEIRKYVKYFLIHYDVEPINSEIIEKVYELIDETGRTNKSLEQAYKITSNFPENLSKTSLFIYLIWMSLGKCLKIKGLFHDSCQIRLLNHYGRFILDLYLAKGDLILMNSLLHSYIEDITNIQRKLAPIEILESIKWTISAVEIFMSSRTMNARAYDWLTMLDEKITKSITLSSRVELVLQETFEVFKLAPKMITSDCLYVDYLHNYVKNAFIRLTKLKEDLNKEILDLASIPIDKTDQEILVFLNKLTFRVKSIYPDERKVIDTLHQIRQLFFKTSENNSEITKLKGFLDDYPNYPKEIIFFGGFLFMQATKIIKNLDNSYEFTLMDEFKMKLFKFYLSVEIQRLGNNFNTNIEKKTFTDFYAENMADIDRLKLEDGLSLLIWSMNYVTVTGKYEQSWLADLTTFHEMITSDSLENANKSALERVLYQLLQFKTNNEIVLTAKSHLEKLTKTNEHYKSIVNPYTFQLNRKYPTPRELLKTMNEFLIFKWDLIIDPGVILKKFHDKITGNIEILQFNEQESLEYERFIRKFEVYMIDPNETTHLFGCVNMLSSFIEFSKYFYLFIAFAYHFCLNLLRFKQSDIIIDQYYGDLEVISKKSIYMYLEDGSEMLEILLMEDMARCYDSIIAKRNQRMIMKYAKCYLNSQFWLLRRLSDKERKWIEKANNFIATNQADKSKFLKANLKIISDTKPTETLYFNILEYAHKWLKIIATN